METKTNFKDCDLFIAYRWGNQFYIIGHKEDLADLSNQMDSHCHNWLRPEFQLVCSGSDSIPQHYLEEKNISTEDQAYLKFDGLVHLKKHFCNFTDEVICGYLESLEEDLFKTESPHYHLMMISVTYAMSLLSLLWYENVNVNIFDNETQAFAREVKLFIHSMFTVDDSVYRPSLWSLSMFYEVLRHIVK